jgi:hypothetical protein
VLDVVEHEQQVVAREPFHHGLRRPGALDRGQPDGPADCGQDQRRVVHR